jgi:hypothetical protein
MHVQDDSAAVPIVDESLGKDLHVERWGMVEAELGAWNGGGGL